MPAPRIFGISLRGALIVTAGWHSQLLCLLSWRDVLIPREERSRRWIEWVGAASEEGRIVSRSRGYIVPRIVCPIVWHHGPITADKASAMLKLWGCMRDRVARFRARMREGYEKKNITQMCSRRKEYRCRDGEGWTGNDSISSAFLEPLLYELMCRLYQRSRENWESKYKQSELTDYFVLLRRGWDNIFVLFWLLLYIEYLLHLIIITIIYYFLWHLILALIKIAFCFRLLGFCSDTTK